MSIHWLITVTILVGFAQALVYRRWALRKIGYRRYFSTRACFEGEEVQLVEVISNRKLLPIPWLRLESLMHANLQFFGQTNLAINSGQIFQNHRSLFSLMPYTQITRRHRVLCKKRGCYDLQTATMTCGDLLGLAASFTTYQFHNETRLLVYPKPIPIEDVPLPSHSWQGDVTVRRWIVDDPFLIAGVREYRYGDPMNAINWKASARGNKLQVHKRDYTADHRIMIVLNFEIDEKMWSAVTNPERIEKGITYAASIARYAIERGIDTGFACNGCTVDRPKEPVRVPPAGGSAHLTALYDTMAMLVIERSMDFSDFLETEIGNAATNTDYILITSYVSAKMEGQIERLKQNGNAVDIVPLTDDGALIAGSKGGLPA
jgi:hypothetical protein